MQWKNKSVHEDDGRSQEEDTGILVSDKMVGWVSEPGTDSRGLGRWCWINLNGKNGHICRIVCV